MKNKLFFKNRCKRLILKVKAKFPELNDIKIDLRIKELKNASMWAERTLSGSYIITIDPIKYKDATDEQIAGVLPHEFVHFSEFKKWNPLKGLIVSFLQRVSKKFKEYMEKETDKETIRRGFAKQLYANRVFRFKTSSKEYKKRILCFYLNPLEIKYYAQSIKKW